MSTILYSKRMLTKTQAAIVAAIVVIAAIAGVSYLAPPPPSPRTETATTSIVTTKYGGTLVIGSANEPESGDPLYTYARFGTFTLTNNIYDRLVSVNFNNEIVPELAESWEPPDDLTFIFHLRKGIKFHDGTPLNASAVKFNVDRYTTEPGLQAKEYGVIIKSCEALDENTVKIALFKPSPNFIYFLAIEKTGICSPTAVKKWGKDYGRNPVGTGPFKFVEWIRGSQITLEAFNGYWQGRPKIDKLVLKVIPEAAVRLMEIESGSAQVMEVPLPHARRLEKTGKVVIQTGPSDRQHILTYPINPDPKASGIFAKSKELRQALCYAIDRKALIDTVLDGYGWPAVGLIRYGCLGYAPYLAKYNYNITKAKELLAKAGYPNGFKTTLKVEAKAFREYAEDLAVLIKAQLAKVGIDATLEVMDVGTFQKFMFYQDYELLMGGFRGTTPDPWGILRARYHSTAAGPGAGFWNYGAIKDPRLDVLLDMLDRTGEWKVAKQLSDEIQKIVIEEAYECALLDQASLYATAPIVQGLKIHPTYGFYFGATIYKPNVGIDVFLKQAGAGGSISPTAQPITGSSVRLCAAIRRDLRYNVVRQPRME